ncbi:MAG: hypothetical protein PHX16_03480 [Syntrophaceticus sp.]|jgi:hypothetical protein|nr:hypothetical protein [Syntrophaceticus sp.]
MEGKLPISVLASEVLAELDRLNYLIIQSVHFVLFTKDLLHLPMRKGKSIFLKN